MNSTREDATHGTGAPMWLPSSKNFAVTVEYKDASEHGMEASMELPFHMRLKSVELSRMRELIGTQPMETAWEQCWQEGMMPWDVQGVTPAVAQLLRANQLRDGKALVPGCGSGYDVVAMGSPTRRVIGLDISPTALHQAHQLLALNSPGHAAQFVEFHNADFFSFSPPFKFDLVFDYTFFCAIDPSLRPRWAHKMADLLVVDGELITLMFPLDEYERGPPFVVSMDAYEKVLGPWGFCLVSCDSDIPSLKNRTSLEKLGRWERAVPKLDGPEVTNGGLQINGGELKHDQKISSSKIGIKARLPGRVTERMSKAEVSREATKLGLVVMPHLRERIPESLKSKSVTVGCRHLEDLHVCKIHSSSPSDLLHNLHSLGSTTRRTHTTIFSSSSAHSMQRVQCD